MKYATSLLLTMTTITATSQIKADDIIGHWANEDYTADFEMYKTGVGYAAKIVWLSKPKNNKGEIKLDKNNPDKSLRTRPVMNMVILTGLIFSPDKNDWINGKIYSPEKGAYADCTVSLSTKNELKITASKYLVTVTKKWKRYE